MNEGTCRTTVFIHPDLSALFLFLSAPLLLMKQREDKGWGSVYSKM
jgi:hypothetical protein